MTNSRMPQKVFATLALGLLPVIAMADGNWLVGGSLGTTQVRESFSGVRWEPSGTSYGIYGGYQFNDYFALQAGYLDLGSFDDSIVINGTSINIAGDVDGFTVAAVARVPFGKRFDAHAKLGWYSYDATIRIDGVGDSTSESDVFFGIGLGLGLTEKVSLNLDAQRYKLSAVHANVLSLGLQVNFR